MDGMMLLPKGFIAKASGEARTGVPHSLIKDASAADLCRCG
jgi:hypothetical protein